MLSVIQQKWADFLHAVAGGLRDVPGMDAVALKLGGAAIEAGSAFYEMAAAATAAKEKSDDLAASAREAANAALVPLGSVQALRDALKGADADSEDALEGTGKAAERVVAAVNKAGGAAKKAAEIAKSAWETASASLKTYAANAADIGKGLGDTLTGAFKSAESAFKNFIKTGKLDFKSLASSILADLAMIALKKNILGPIANWLSGSFGSVFAGIFHDGGMVGGAAPSRSVPAMAFAGAPRMHGGGWAGLRPDEVPTILQRGERVLSRQEVARGVTGNASGGVTVHIDARGAQTGVAEQIDTKLRAAIPEIARIAKQSVADGRRRGQAL